MKSYIPETFGIETKGVNKFFILKNLDLSKHFINESKIWNLPS